MSDKDALFEVIIIASAVAIAMSPVFIMKDTQQIVKALNVLAGLK